MLLFADRYYSGPVDAAERKNIVISLGRFEQLTAEHTSHMSFIRRYSNLSLSVRVTAILLALIIVIAGVLIYLFDRSNRDQLSADIRFQLNSRATFASKEFRADVEPLRQAVVFLSQTPPIQGIIHAERDGHDWKHRLAKIFTAFANTHPHYNQIRFIGIADQGRELVRVDRIDGKVVATPDEALQQKGSHDYFKETLNYQQGEVYLSDINLNREHGAVQAPHIRTLRAATPVFKDDTGELYGMIVINIDIGEFIDKLAMDLPSGMQAYLLNARGDYLLHPLPSHTFGFDLAHTYRWQDDFPDAPLNSEGNNVSRQRVLAQGNYLYLSSATINIDPERPERFLKVVYTFPESAISRQISEQRRLVVGGLLGAALLISGLIFIVLRRMFSPLNRLTETARQIGSGHAETVLPRVMQGEVGTFVGAFNEMLVKIQNREKQIGKLNRELEKNETFLNLIYETVPEAIMVVDEQGEMVRVNHQAGRIFGYSVEEMEGQRIEILLPESLRERHVGMREHYHANAEPRMMGRGRDLAGCRKDGSEFPVEVGIAPMWMEGRLFVIVSVVDISERKRIERAVRNSQEDFFRLIASNVKDYAIIMLDSEGKVVTWNEGAERIEGYKAEEIVGHSAELFYLPKDVKAGIFSNILEQARKNGHYQDEGWRVRKDGSRFYTELVITAMRDTDGKLVGFTKIDHDITERRQVQEEIRQFNTELEIRVQERTAELAAANKELDSFAYAVSHDLRAPLRAMIGFSEALVEDFSEQLPLEAQEYLHEIAKAGENMSGLIDGLLSLSRSTRGELHRDRFDISALVNEISQELSQSGEAENVEWKIEPDLMAEGDIRTIKIALRNLLSNAVKYSAQSNRPRVEFFRERNERGEVFCVADNGAGFDMAHAERLFKPFQRLHRHDEFPGIGIGLATVQRIIHRHGGEIHAHASLGLGAQFYFTLPIVNGMNADAQDIAG